MKINDAAVDVQDYLEERLCGFESNQIPVVTTSKGESSPHALPFTCDPEKLLEEAGVASYTEPHTEILAEEMRGSPSASILLAGSSKDKQVGHFMRRVKKKHLIQLLTGPLTATDGGYPPFTWSLQDDKLWINRVEAQPKAAFVRYQFHAETSDPDPATARRTHAWHAAVSAWVAAHPEVRTFNRHQRAMFWHKPAVLHLAMRLGLAVPETVFGNDVERLRRKDGVIKPIDGRGYCQYLDDVLSGVGPDQLCTQPVAVQRKLEYPELRVYVIGSQRFGVSITSDALDYRSSRLDSGDVRRAEIPSELNDKLSKLVEALGLDFCAADFKTRPGSDNELVLLDVNDAPMFADCDDKLNGDITKAMVRFLLQT